MAPNYDAQLIQQKWYDGCLRDKGIYQLIANMRKNYAVMVISGNIWSRIDLIKDKYRFRHLFEMGIYSFDLRMIKPEREFRGVMIKKCRVWPEEIVLIGGNDSYGQAAMALRRAYGHLWRVRIERLQKGRRADCVQTPDREII